MAEEQETRRLAKGFRFDPFDEELITDYLKPTVEGKQTFIKFRDVYGPASNPWYVFPDDDPSWFISPHLKDTEKCMFVFSKLSKVSKAATNSTNSKKAKAGSENTSKKAGCGTWDGKTSRKKIRDGQGNIIGQMRYLTFEINEIDSRGIGFDLSKVGFYKMHEYSLGGINSGMNSSIVLCKITYDSSKPCTINRKSGRNVTKSSGQELGVFTQETEETMLAVPSTVPEENLTGIHGGGVDPELDAAFSADFNFDDFCVESFCLLGDEFDGEADLGDVCFDVDWIMRTLGCDPQERLVEDNSIINLGKRKFEAQEDSRSSKKTCLE